MKDTLGGNCKTVMIATVSPSSLQWELTHNTLKMAAKAKKVRNQVSPNVLAKKKEVKLITKFKEKLKVSF